MSENPFKSAIHGDDSDYEGEAGPSRPTERLLLRRFAAWWIDLLAIFILQGTVVLVIYVPFLLLKAMPENNQLLQSVFAIVPVIVFILMAVLRRTPGFAIMRLRFRKSEKVHWAWWIRSSRFAGLPMVFLFGGIGMLADYLGMLSVQLRDIQALTLGPLVFLGAFSWVAGSLFCLAPSGRSLLDRVFNLVVVRS